MNRIKRIFCLNVLFALFSFVSVADQRSEGQVYVPFYGEEDMSLGKPGSERGDYAAATRSETLIEAQRRWEYYLATYFPEGKTPKGQFEVIPSEMARHELMRVYYLLGKMKEGDAIFRKIDPVHFFDGKRGPTNR